MAKCECIVSRRAVRIPAVVMFSVLLAGCDVAGFFWPDRPAPWEHVDPIFYPNRNDLSRHELGPRVDNLEACRAWIYAEAVRRGDPSLKRGTFECGVGSKQRLADGTRVYRITVR